MLVAAVLIVVILALVVFLERAPNTTLLAYFLVYSGFLGLFDMASLPGLSVENVIFLFSAAMAVILVVNGLRPKGGYLPWQIYLFLGFFLFGTAYPVFQGNSGFVSALTDGKDLLAYTLLGYLVLMRDRLDFRQIIGFLILYSYLMIGWLILFALTGFFPPAYEPVGEDGGLHLKFASVIALAFLFQLVRTTENATPARWAGLLVLTVGLAIQPHRSVFLVTLAVLFGYWFLFGSVRERLLQTGGGVVAGVALLTVIGLGPIVDSLVGPIRELTQLEGAIGSRLNISALRISLILQEPVFGYGFIDESSPMGAIIAERAANRFEQTLGVVDAGYLDLAIRFGLVGVFAFTAAYILLAYRGVFRSSEPIARMMGVFLASYLGIGLTWSVMTYIHGIVPACLAIFLMLYPSYWPYGRCRVADRHND
ncbi:MAG: hypothetical protein MI755_16135 [Sphingomonadales bacterium]|nr:hypothetical protein [Sphingomonadales bacterium]